MTQRSSMISHIEHNVDNLYDLCDMYKLLLPFPSILIDVSRFLTSEKVVRLYEVIIVLHRELLYTFGTLKLMVSAYKEDDISLVKKKLVDHINGSAHTYGILILLELIYIVREVVMGRVSGANSFTSEMYLDNLFKLARLPEYTYNLRCSYVKYIIDKETPLDKFDWPDYYYNRLTTTTKNGITKYSPVILPISAIVLR